MLVLNWYENVNESQGDVGVIVWHKQKEKTARNVA
jgi:hypothetical protein